MRVDARVLENSLMAYVVLILLADDALAARAWYPYALLAFIALCELYAAYVTLRRDYDPDFGLLKRVRHTRPTGIYALYVGLSVLSVECLILIGLAIRPLSLEELAEIAAIFAAVLFVIFSLPGWHER
jgi:membrane protease YdiL (CAAX protease family)